MYSITFSWCFAIVWLQICLEGVQKVQKSNNTNTQTNLTVAIQEVLTCINGNVIRSQSYGWIYCFYYFIIQSILLLLTNVYCNLKVMIYSITLMCISICLCPNLWRTMLWNWQWFIHLETLSIYPEQQNICQ